ncbi:hypothetical protein WOLCODRAFT_86299, partial [Wolfiporia cocos MD-104 SS10]
DDIMTEYHPSSYIPRRIQPFEEYGQEDNEAPSPPMSKSPWEPFQTRADFEFAEIALKSSLKRDQIDSLIKLINAVATGSMRFSLTSEAQLRDVWDAASNQLTPFEKHTITVPYKNETREFNVYGRDVWEWVLDLLKNPTLSQHWHWNPTRLYRYTGSDWERFIHEPWTGDRLWEVQSKLPPGATAFGIIIYADKTRLSSFGTQKGYPVVARVAHLPAEIRNSEGVGGGCVVGWLPIVDNDSAEDGKTSFADFKRVVWHKGFLPFMNNVAQHSRTGYHVKCADEILRWIWIFILILSADYEEQCFMALIRGANGLCPCPICLVPSSQLADVSVEHPLRTSVDSAKLLKTAKALPTKAEQEAVLKKYGLRSIQNSFWKIANTDVHKALSFDRLHAYHLGLFGDHLWPEIKAHVNNIGRDAAIMVDDQASKIPRWRGFNHFDNIMGINFTDGRKLEDMSKLAIFATHNILSTRPGSAEYLLLRCLRSYLVLDMYLSFEVHTSRRLAEGQEELLRFSKLIKEYSSKMGGSKNWNFPKAHSHQHAFQDIKEKGVTRNYNTKPNEKMHRSLKKAYQQTNYKDIADQILTRSHNHQVASLIRSRIDDYDAYIDYMKNGPIQEDIDNDGLSNISFGSAHIHLGAAEKPVEISALRNIPNAHAAFSNFHKHLGSFLGSFLAAQGLRFANYPVKVTEYRLLKVNYESYETWRTATDLLRCNPDFHGKPRYDYVLLKTTERPIFAQLIFVFTYLVKNVIDSSTPNGSLQ